MSLPKKGKRSNPGSELVAFSRVIDIFALSICDIDNLISIETLKNIGIMIIYNTRRRKFDKLLKMKDALSRGIVKDNITKFFIVKKMKIKYFWVDTIFYCAIYSIVVELFINSLLILYFVITYLQYLLSFKTLGHAYQYGGT